VPLLASLCQGIGGDMLAVQRGKSDKPRERDFFPWAYLSEDAQGRNEKPESGKFKMCYLPVRRKYGTFEE